jgi:hypothetical protein
VAWVVADRVKETSTTTGLGNFTLAGAAAQYRALSAVVAIGAVDLFSYCIQGQSGTEWEIGVGALLDAVTLIRAVVLSSSNANALVNFSAGTKDVFLTDSGDLHGVISLTQNAPFTGVVAGTCLLVARKYTIPAGKKLGIGSGGILKVT